MHDSKRRKRQYRHRALWFLHLASVHWEKCKSEFTTWITNVLNWKNDYKIKETIKPTTCPGQIPDSTVVAFFIIFFFFFGASPSTGEMQMATPAVYSSNSINVPERLAEAIQSIWAASMPSTSGVREGLGNIISLFPLRFGWSRKWK